MISIEEMKKRSSNFVKNREWDRYHTPKNLSMALTIEATELMEIFQWVDNDTSKDLLKNRETLQSVKDELGDIMHCLIRLSDVMEIDLIQAYFDKMKKNEEKYPIHLSKGKTEKYTKLKQD